MQDVIVRFSLDRAACILAGKAQFGAVDVKVDPALLSEDQRFELAQLPVRDSTLEMSGDLKSPSNVMLGTAHLPAVIEPTAEAVTCLLQARTDARKRMLAETAAKAEEALAKGRQNVAEWMSTPDEKLISGSNGYRVRGAALWGEAEVLAREPEYRARMRRLEVLARTMREEAEARRRAAEAERQAKAEAAEAAQRDQIKQWVEMHGTPTQRKRLSAGLLSEREVIDGIRGQVFAALESFPRFDRLTKTGVYAALPSDAYDRYERPDVEFAADPATEATDAEFETFDAIQTVIRRDHPDAKVEMIESRGKPEDCNDWIVRRKSVKVTVTVGAFTVSRRYACP